MSRAEHPADLSCGLLGRIRPGGSLFAGRPLRVTRVDSFLCFVPISSPPRPANLHSGLGPTARGLSVPGRANNGNSNDRSNQTRLIVLRLVVRVPVAFRLSCRAGGDDDFEVYIKAGRPATGGGWAGLEQ